MNLEKYVYLKGEDEALIGRVRETFEWFASTPEGKEALEDALKLHQKPLQVYVGEDVFPSGYGRLTDEPHTMFINPDAVERMIIITESDEKETYSLRRFIAHECEHARQPDVLAKAGTYSQACADIFAEAEEEVLGAPVRAAFKKRKSRIQDEESLRVVAGEVYDEVIVPLRQTFSDRLVVLMQASPLVNEFIEAFEKPALEFENLVARNHQLGSPRSTDYLRSADLSASPECFINRQNFVDFVIEGYHHGRKQAEESQFWRNLVADGGHRSSPAFARGGV